MKIFKNTLIIKLNLNTYITSQHFLLKIRLKNILIMADIMRFLMQLEFLQVENSLYQFHDTFFQMKSLNQFQERLIKYTITL